MLHSSIACFCAECINAKKYTLARYNFENEKRPLLYFHHRLDGMINVFAKLCEDPGCKTQASCNFNGHPPRFCGVHKQPGMRCVDLKKCQTPHCDIKGSEKYENYCLFCYMHTFPDRPVARNYKTKEKAICDFILEQFPHLKWTIDKKINGGTSNRRPDLLVDLGHQIVIVEIDEGQHKVHERICENKRTMEISKDLNHKPTVFIRFNPDGYTKDKQHIPSCWVANKMGIITIPRNKKNEWEARLKTLKEEIKKWTNPINKNTQAKTVEVCQLFYDQ